VRVELPEHERLALGVREEEQLVDERGQLRQLDVVQLAQHLGEQVAPRRLLERHLAQRLRHARHRRGVPRRLDERTDRVLDDLRAVVHLVAVLERDAALVDGREQPEALGQEHVRLGGAAARAGAQRRLQAAQDDLDQVKQRLGVEVLELGDEPVGAPLGHLGGQCVGRQGADQAARHRIEPRHIRLVGGTLKGGRQQRGQVRVHVLALDQPGQVAPGGLVQGCGGRGLLALDREGLAGRSKADCVSGDTTVKPEACESGGVMWHPSRGHPGRPTAAPGLTAPAVSPHAWAGVASSRAACWSQRRGAKREVLPHPAVTRVARSRSSRSPLGADVSPGFSTSLRLATNVSCGRGCAVCCWRYPLLRSCVRVLRSAVGWGAWYPPGWRRRWHQRCLDSDSPSRRRIP
jgi:hypothetical protein